MGTSAFLFESFSRCYVLFVQKCQSNNRLSGSCIHIFLFSWWRGQSGQTAGWFPSNYTQEEVDSDDALHTYAMAENVLDIVVALYSFSSTNDQELSFDKGDRLEIIDRPAADPEWYKARNSHGQTGLIPRNYVQVSCSRNYSFRSLTHIKSW